MRKNNDRMRRVGVAALAIVAAGAAAFGGATAANAAAGTSNQGASDVVIAPSGALNFLSDETTGMFTWKMGDGRADSVANWSVTAGDQATYVLNSPEGLTFPNMGQYCDEDHLPGFTTTCDISENRRAITVTYTADASGPVNLGFADRDGLAFPVRAIDGSWVEGVPTVTYTPFPGLQTSTPNTTGIVQQSLPGASGTSNQGIRSVHATPTSPAVNFDTPGTPGHVTWNISDYKDDSVANWSVAVGDVSEYTITLPEGVTFDDNPPCLTYSFASSTCSLSADKRTYTVSSTVHTALENSTLAFSDFVTPPLPITSTGPVAAWNTFANYTPWYTPGSDPLQQIETGEDSANVLFVGTPSNETPLLAGGIIAGLGLAGAGAVYGIRRHKKVAR